MYPITKREARSVSNRNVEMRDRQQRNNLVSTIMGQTWDKQVPDNVDYSQQCTIKSILKVVMPSWWPIYDTGLFSW